jgi:hypothetical protein
LIVPTTFETWATATSLTSPLVERQPALVVDVEPVERRPGALADELPRHEVRVVLHLGDHDAVARAEVRAAPRVRDEVQRLGDVPGEDRLGDAPAGERGDALARALEQLGRLHLERVDAAVDGRAMGLVVVVHRVDHRARRLRRRRAVEVDEPLAVERRELVRERGVGERAHQAAAATSSRTQP